MARVFSQVQNQHGLTVSRWRDYYELTKPKVVMLLLLTALVGMCLATPTWVDWQVLVTGLIGIGLLAASAAVINHVVDQNIDVNMARTRHRPVAKGRVSTLDALVFAAVLAVVGFVSLWFGTNALTAWLTLASLVIYAGIYTGFLKRATPQNIVIGGVAGAAPPLLGWSAVTNTIDPHALLLVLIIFTWTPPHFWALAINREKDYANAKVPMLPVTHGVSFTKTCVLLYTVLLMVVCWLPYLVGMTEEIYLIGATILNAGFLYWAIKLKFFPDADTAMKTFRFSILHLMVLFVVLLLDHYVVL